jgi:hypothetical protein
MEERAVAASEREESEAMEVIPVAFRREETPDS